MKLKFHPEVKNDINNLDGSVKPRLKSTLNKIKRSPELGKLLGNKSGIDLSGCLKIYFYRKKYRVVYEILNEEEVMVWSIGKREDQVVYISAYKRILEKGR
jgi:mRNA interferase RelE/StbE